MEKQIQWTKLGLLHPETRGTLLRSLAWTCGTPHRLMLDIEPCHLLASFDEGWSCRVGEEGYSLNSSLRLESSEGYLRVEISDGTQRFFFEGFQ